MKAKLLRSAGEIAAGAMVEITSTAGTNDDRTDEDVGGSSMVAAPVYTVTDDEGHVEEVDTRDLQVMPKEAGGHTPRRVRARRAK